MNKICTTIEQSKKLIELGIDKYITWDMCYLLDRKDEQPTVVSELFTRLGASMPQVQIQVIPAWSLSALLELLPSATLDISNNHGYRIHCCGKFTEWHDTAVDAAVAMIKRLKELNKQ